MEFALLHTPYACYVLQPGSVLILTNNKTATNIQGVLKVSGDGEAN
jgi:hypothetical protein